MLMIKINNCLVVRSGKQRLDDAFVNLMFKVTAEALDSLNTNLVHVCVLNSTEAVTAKEMERINSSGLEISQEDVSKAIYVCVIKTPPAPKDFDITSLGAEFEEILDHSIDSIDELDGKLNQLCGDHVVMCKIDLSNDVPFQHIGLSLPSGVKNIIEELIISLRNKDDCTSEMSEKIPKGTTLQ